MILTQYKPPDKLLSWLTYPECLTAKLQIESGHAKLQLLSQQWASPDVWDRCVLNLHIEPVLHREILMWSADYPCWYARTIVPKTTYDKNPILFNRLKHQSLGQLIFQDKCINRHDMMHFYITEQSMEYAWLHQAMHQNSIVLWGRYSALMLHTIWPLFLIEIFLPGLLTVMTP